MPAPLSRTLNCWLPSGSCLALTSITAQSRPAAVRGLVMLAASPRFVRADDWDAGMDPSVFRNFAHELGRDYRGTLDRFLMLEAQGSEKMRDELRLPISAVNVDEVNIDFFRIDAEYLPRFLAEYRPGAGMGNWDLEQVTQRAKRVFSGRYALALDANRRETRLINVKEPQLAEAGVYFAVMSPLGNYDWRKETTYFAVSDMGLSARRYRDQLEVFVSSLASADPLKEVQLSLLDEKGNRLQVQTTDPQGHRRFDQVQGARLLLAEQGSRVADASGTAIRALGNIAGYQALCASE